MSAAEPVAYTAIDPKSLQTNAVPLGKTLAPAAPPYTWLSFSQTGLSKYMNAAKNAKNTTKKGGRRRRNTQRRRRVSRRA
jgi:hypothetical protein